MFIFKAMLLPMITLGQVQNIPSVMLKTLDDRTVNTTDIIKNNQYTIIYFFDSNSKDLTDHFEYLAKLSTKYSQKDKIKIMAICYASNGNSNNLKPLLGGNDISVNTYVDINGEFQRAIGLAANSAFLVIRPDQSFTYYYSESIDYYLDLFDVGDFPYAYNDHPY